MKATSVPAMRKWAHRRPSQGCAETSSLTTDDEYFAAWPIWKRHVPGPSPGRSYIRTLRIADSVSPSGNRTVDVKRTIGIAGPTIVVRLPSGSPTATALRKSPGECGDPAHAARASVMAAIEKIERCTLRCNYSRDIARTLRCAGHRGPRRTVWNTRPK